jgi:SAM-dependent methyltransferase
VHRPPDFWHARYLQQASWTAPLRQRACALASLSQASCVLEVGSGTGVITADLRGRTRAHVFGVDLELEVTRFARHHDPATRFSLADAQRLPFADSSFDATVTHFLLLWVEDPWTAVREMARVTRSGGWVLCLAEPDYGGRVDHPASLAEAGKLQAEALRRQGADPQVGRKLREMLTRCGLADVQVGVLGGEWQEDRSRDELKSEWLVLESDLGGLVSQERLTELRRIDVEAWESGSRVLFVPTFFAFGRKPPWDPESAPTPIIAGN